MRKELLTVTNDSTSPSRNGEAVEVVEDSSSEHGRGVRARHRHERQQRQKTDSRDVMSTAVKRSK